MLKASWCTPNRLAEDVRTEIRGTGMPVPPFNVVADRIDFVLLGDYHLKSNDPLRPAVELTLQIDALHQFVLTHTQSLCAVEEKYLIASAII